MPSNTVTLEKTLSFAENKGQLLVTLISEREKKEGEVKRSCKDCKHELVNYDSLPDFLKHNEFIVNYYRSEWPLKQTILSIFSIHNETLNIWTHLIGFFIFLVLATTLMAPVGTSVQPTTTTLSSISNASIPLNSHHELLVILSPAHANQTDKSEPENTALHPVARWPFYAYLAGAMFCLLASSACHLLSCHSECCAYLQQPIENHTDLKAQ